jgi:hypothetical protein
MNIDMNKGEQLHEEEGARQLQAGRKHLGLLCTAPRSNDDVKPMLACQPRWSSTTPLQPVRPKRPLPAYGARHAWRALASC